MDGSRWKDYHGHDHHGWRDTWLKLSIALDEQADDGYELMSFTNWRPVAGQDMYDYEKTVRRAPRARALRCDT